MERIHAPRPEQGDGDDGRHHVALGAEVHEGENGREDRRTEGAPLQDRMNEAPAQAAVHGVDELGRRHARRQVEVEGRRCRPEIHAGQLQQERRQGDPEY